MEVRKSQIHGVGVFATKDIPEGGMVGLYLSTTRENNIRTLRHPDMDEDWYEIGELGRYCNHQTNCNTEVMITGKNISLISKGIAKDEEITSDYNIISSICKYPTDTSNFIEL